MKLAQLVIGPAGVGKSTYCDVLLNHCRTIGRSIHVVNLDPAAEALYCPVVADIRDLIELSDVTETLGLGPNGGLIYCMEYFESHMTDWLNDALDAFTDDDYVLFDCPGQTELYSHCTVFRTFVDHLETHGWTVCAVYCLDALFLTDISKFVGGCFQALSAMVRLDIPHLNILTKIDLCPDKEAIEDFLCFDKHQLLHQLQFKTRSTFQKLNEAVVDLIHESSFADFIPLNINDNKSVHEVLMHMDQATHFGEDMDSRLHDFDI